MGCNSSKSASVIPNVVQQINEGEKLNASSRQIRVDQLNGPENKLEQTVDNIDQHHTGKLSPRRQSSRKLSIQGSPAKKTSITLPKIAFNWRTFKQKKVELITAQFSYSYDPESHAFRINNDSTNYTVSELTWNYLDEYDVYNFTLTDQKVINIQDQSTTILQIKVPYSFDVSSEGKFLGIPDIDEVLKGTFQCMGHNFEVLTPQDHQAVLKFLDIQLRCLWKSLVENTIENQLVNAKLIQDEKVQYFEIKKLDTEDPIKIRQYIENVRIQTFIVIILEI